MSILRSRLVQSMIAVVTLFFIYWVFPRLDSYSPEEINDFLQNKHSETVRLKKHELRAQALSVPYLDPNLRSPNWSFAGKTMVRGDEYIRLTSDKKQQAGSMFSRMPVQAESFEMELNFHIHSDTGNGLVADGMAIWFIDEPSPIGDVFGAKNNFNGLGIFVDTYRNGGKGSFPYISAMLGDGQTSYAKESDGMETKLAGCTAKAVLNPSSGSTRMRIIALKDGYLSVDLNYNPERSGDWKNCFTLLDVHLPVVKYLGFSAETGALSQSVDLIENKVYALFEPQSDLFIGSISQLEELMQEQEVEESNPSEDDKPRRRGRRSLSRLKKAEQRIKARERMLRLQKYGDEEATFVKRWVRRFLKTVKAILVLLLVVLVVWVAFILYRVQKQKRRSRTTGLLD